MSITALARVTDALDAAGCAPRGNGTQWQARCPAHDDRNPSLSVTAESDRVLVNCHGGCDIDDVLTALRLTRADLFDEAKRPDSATPKMSIAATYDYHDEQGTLLYQVVRMDPKDFRQRKPTGHDTWDWSTKGVRRVLYRLPQVLEAIAADRTIYVVEGEKDVHAVERAGGVATTNPGGAGKWLDAYSQQLAGARVLVVTDIDGPNPTHPDKGYVGQRHAADVARRLKAHVRTIDLLEPLAGKDISDHFAAGHTLRQLQPHMWSQDAPGSPQSADDLGGVLDDPGPPEGLTERHIRLTPASSIAIRPVRWVWDGRLALGTLGLLAGEEGLGKSTLAYWLAARITRGELPGEYQHKPAAVLVAATEDSWEHTIVPRLMAAGANLDKIYRVDVITEESLMVSISMPRDLQQIEHAAEDVGAALMLLDPLMSRLDAKLDTHKDAEVRTALEPLVAIADRARMAIIGLIHHNKSGSSNPLTAVMASKAFTAVARSVHTVIRDPDDESDERRLFGTPKNNLGKANLPTLAYTITGAHVGDTEEGPVWTGKLNWAGEVDGTIADAMRRGSGTDEERSAVSEAADWLTDYIEINAGSADSADIKRDGGKAGHSPDALKRARRKLGYDIENVGFPRKTIWKVGEVGEKPRHSNLEGVSRAGARAGGDAPTAPTDDFAPTVSHELQSAQSEQWEQAPRAQARTHARVIPQEEPLTPLFDQIDYVCRVCGEPIDPAVDSTTHPSCDPWGAM